MHDQIERELFDEQTILRRLDVLAGEIADHYEGMELTALAVLNGSIIFAADLLRRIDRPLQLECIAASSYHGGIASSGELHFSSGKLPDLHGRHVLILDDILDTGLTLHALRARLESESQPLSVEICVLLRKQKQRKKSVAARFVGFEISDEFVVGYGLDFQGDYRNLPFIGTLKPEAITAGLEAASTPLVSVYGQ